MKQCNCFKKLYIVAENLSVFSMLHRLHSGFISTGGGEKNLRGSFILLPKNLNALSTLVAFPRWFLIYPIARKIATTLRCYRYTRIFPSYSCPLQRDISCDEEKRRGAANRRRRSRYLIQAESPILRGCFVEIRWSPRFTFVGPCLASFDKIYRSSHRAPLCTSSTSLMPC